VENGAMHTKVHWEKSKAALQKLIPYCTSTKKEDYILDHMMKETCRSFFKETATPIVNCIKDHFKNNTDAFVAIILSLI